jgi:hypothetical protein
MANRLGQWRSAAMAVVVVGLLAGCAQIPTSGPVEEGDQVRAAVDEPLIRVLPRPPQDGLSREQVVSGFLAASASFDDDHSVAREYLTPLASQGWDPDAGVSVYDDQVGLTMKVRGNTVDARARQVGGIGADGAFTTRVGNQVTRQFELTRVDGQWRIAGLADGLLLTRLDVVRTYRSYSLMFLAPGQDRLVPDPVYVPVDRAGAATSLVGSLLNGPTRWLAPAVNTAIPSGTHLVVDAVPVENGIAQVDLSREALEAVDVQRDQMVAQLVWTLTGLPDVTGVQISVEGTPLQISGGGTVQAQEDWAQFDPNAIPEPAMLLLVRHGTVYEASEEKANPVSNVLGTGSVDASDPTSSADGQDIAALTESGHTAVLVGTDHPDQLVTVHSGGAMAPPSMDATGGLWLAERTDGATSFWVRPADGKLQHLVAPGLRHRRVVAFSVALDGTRAVVVTKPKSSNKDKGGASLFLCRIVRSGNTVSLQAPRPLAASIQQIADVSWSSSQSLLVLGHAPGAVRQPYQVQLDGTFNAVGGASLQGIVSVTAAPGQPLVAATRDASLWLNNGTKWRRWTSGSEPGYPG